MPQDSTYIITPQGVTIRHSDTETVKISSYPPQENDPDPYRSEQGDYAAGFLILGIFVLAFTSPLWIRFLLLRFFRFFRKNIQEPVLEKKLTRIYDDKWVLYKNWLYNYNPYYKGLPENQKERFLIRTLEFLSSKKFHFQDMAEEERVPVLISAAAVQLTFGLKEFRLDFFKDIYILKQNYRYGLYNVPFEGHVSSDGIYLSWSNFDREYADYTDGSNVGLHEMAHALTYVNFTVSDGTDKDFKERFYVFTRTGRRIFGEMQAGKSNLLGDYAATDYQEFWAVSIENFFERPRDLKRELPDLYMELVVLLNQDPLYPGELIQPIDSE